jgi:hypothetical protein
MITLESKILEIKSIKKKTSAKMFKNLKIGDKIKISVDISKPNAVAKFIKCENLATKEINLFNSCVGLPKILDCFEFVNKIKCIACEEMFDIDKLDFYENEYFCPDCHFGLGDLQEL